MSAHISDPPPPLIYQLPDRVLRHIAALLDVRALHNWRTLARMVPQYTHMEFTALSIEEQSGRSAAQALLYDLHSRGWTVWDLAVAAQEAQLAIIVDTLKQHCQETGIPLVLPEDGSPSPLHPLTLPKSASSCYHRPPLPPSPPPPYPHTMAQNIQAELQTHSAPPPEAAPPETTPPREPVEVPYEVLSEGTAHFSQLPYKEGGHKLGEGGFGEVFWCRVKVGGGKVEAAVKVLREKESSSGAPMDKQQFLTELKALSILSHECLLPVLGYSCGLHLCLLYPFMPHGSLDFHLHSPHTLTPHRRMQVACDVGRALEYLHCGAPQVVVHRDVKSANILLTETWRARLGDFGVARFLPSSHTTLTTTVVGTLVYMAPEYSRGAVSPAADIYAFGVVLYELLTGLSAQEDVDEAGTDLLSYIEDYEGEVSDILIGQWPVEVGKGVWSLAERCVEHNRKKRPVAPKLCQELEALHTQIRTH